MDAYEIIENVYFNLSMAYDEILSNNEMNEKIETAFDNAFTSVNKIKTLID